MAAPLSFTRGYSPRYPAPDVSRGFMLLLIAFANVGAWAVAVGPRQFDSAADAVLTLLRVIFVDHRAYPLFAILFGFGLMVMVKRRREQYVKAALAGVTGAITSQQAAHSDINLADVFDRDATRTARRLLWSRGGWMLLFGLVHGILFPGDILGTYALICLLFASTLAKERYRSIIVIGAIMAAFMLVSMGIVGYLDPSLIVHQQIVHFDYSLMGVLANIDTWAGIAVPAALGSFALLGVGVGAYVATTDILARPDQHGRLLEMCAAVGLLVGVLGGLPFGLVESEFIHADLAWWMRPLHELSGFFGALGWLALLVRYAGPTPMFGQLRGLRWVLSAVGRRSLTSYLLQSILFAVIFASLYWYGARVSELSGALIAAGVWCVTVLIAVCLERVERQGPFEWLLRTAVTKSVRPVSVPAHILQAESSAARSVPEQAAPIHVAPGDPALVQGGLPFSMKD